MQIHNLKRRNKNKRSAPVGRGGKRGKTSGKGTKGQNARAGRKKRPELRDIIKRIPKLRGRGKNINTSIQVRPVVINLSDLELNFSNGETVSPKTLFEKKMIKKTSGKYPAVKILGSGEVTKSFNIELCEISKSGREKVASSGGSVK